VSRTDFLSHYQPVTIKNTLALASYSSRTVQAAVAACKFEKNRHAANLLAALYERWLMTHPVPKTTILIPIPLSDTRERERGFNQVTRVLEAMSMQPHHEIKTTWLVRPADTLRQTSLGRAARLQNMKGVFATTPYIQQYNWSGVSRIIICDDVMTTGATLEAARAAIAIQVPRHIKIICLAWAH
jgi:predicted amidophosphoribosyltransferase